MLQQTQVGRVVEKYKEFLLRFPDIAAAAHAPLSAIMVRKALGQLRAEGFIYKKGKRCLSTIRDRRPAGSTGIGLNPDHRRGAV
jgi:hypothetical protein